MKVAQSIGSEYGLVQTYHGGVEYYNFAGKAKELPTVEEEEQEKVGRRWLDGEGGCLVTHNRSFSGCEASTCIYISRRATDPGVRSGMLRGVARLVLVGNTGYNGYKKEKLSEKFDVIEL